VSRQDAYEKAAACYHQAGYEQDAARCYQHAGAHRRAAELYESLGEYPAAAAAYQDAGLAELGAWLLAHVAAEPGAARALLARAKPSESGEPAEPGVTPGLRPRLILARCEIAEGAAPQSIRPVIKDVCAALVDRSVRADQYAEDWAVALSESARRYDQAALVYAAAVRGGRHGAGYRWNLWSRRVLGTDVILPPSSPAAT
jgi:hypothetical protein